ncbi:MAG: class I SAM-dependent methyltransferase [Thermodesulfobacteriota bacterium]
MKKRKDIVDLEKGNPHLFLEITNSIKDKGRITFAEFMDTVLYHPSYGYYTLLSERMGDRGDFITSPEIHRVFGRLLAKQIAQVWNMLGSKEDFWIVEIGAGKGLLCRDILSCLEEDHPLLYRGLYYGIIERSPSLVQRQQEIIIEKEGRSEKVFWFGSVDDSPLKEGIEGCMISNEFFDALPVHRVKQKDNLKEIYVGYDGRFQEVIDEPSTHLLETYFKDVSVELKEDMEAEVNLNALDWIEELGKILRKGVIITVDYGYPARELYSPKRFKGTLLCYFRHRAWNDPYKRLGLQDITAHVDFTGLAQRGERCGLSVTGFTDQGSFLIGLGILNELQVLREDAIEDNMAIKSLFMPGGFGDTFNVLIQHKGIPYPSLDGLNWKNMKERL